MANYTSTHTGAQIDSAIQKVLELLNTSTEINDAVAKALKLDDFQYASDEVVGGSVYHVLWKVKPTSSNTVCGFAVHPTTGEPYVISSVNGTKTGSMMLTVSNVPLVSNKDIDDLFK